MNITPYRAGIIAEALEAHREGLEEFEPFAAMSAESAHERKAAVTEITDMLGEFWDIAKGGKKSTLTSE